MVTVVTMIDLGQSRRECYSHFSAGMREGLSSGPGLLVSSQGGCSHSSSSTQPSREPEPLPPVEWVIMQPEQAVPERGSWGGRGEKQETLGGAGSCLRGRLPNRRPA